MLNHRLADTINIPVVTCDVVHSIRQFQKPIRTAKKIIKLFSFSRKFHSMIAIFILSSEAGAWESHYELENRIKSNHRTEIALEKAKGREKCHDTPTGPLSNDTLLHAWVRRLLKWKNKKSSQKTVPGNSFRYLIYGTLLLKGRSCPKKEEPDTIILSFFHANTEMINLNTKNKLQTASMLPMIKRSSGWNNSTPNWVPKLGKTREKHF